MMRQMVCVAVMLLGATVAAQGEELRWQRMPDVPYGVISGAASVVGQCIVVSGGYGQDGLPARLIQVFDMTTSTWRPALRMEVGRSGHAQVTVGDQVLIIGGSTAWGYRPPVGTTDCRRVDVQTMTVQAMAPLPQAIASPTAHVMEDGRVVVVGDKVACVYDAQQDRWGPAIALNRKRVGQASVYLGAEKVVVIGGQRASMEVVDAAAGESRLLACELPWAMDDLRATLLPDGRVWVIGGQRTDNGDTVDQTWVVRIAGPQGDHIEPGPSLQMDGGVADHVLVEIGPWVVLSGGESQRQGQDMERVECRLLDRRSLQVWSLPSTSVPHDDAMAVPVGAAAVVLSGYRTTASGSGLRPLPIAVREVERLQLPPAAMDPQPRQ